MMRHAVRVPIAVPLRVRLSGVQSHHRVPQRRFHPSRLQRAPQPLTERVRGYAERGFKGLEYLERSTRSVNLHWPTIRQRVKDFNTSVVANCKQNWPTVRQQIGEFNQGVKNKAQECFRNLKVPSNEEWHRYPMKQIQRDQAILQLDPQYQAHKIPFELDLNLVKKHIENYIQHHHNKHDSYISWSIIFATGSIVGMLLVLDGVITIWPLVIGNTLLWGKAYYHSLRKNQLETKLLTVNYQLDLAAKEARQQVKPTDKC